MKKQKGFIQIPLLIIVITSVVVASVGASVVLYKQGKLAPLVANISEILKGGEEITIPEEIELKSEDLQLEQILEKEQPEEIPEEPEKALEEEKQLEITLEPKPEIQSSQKETEERPPEKPTCESSEEICDGIDNDCDKLIDENLTRECGTSYLGICRLGIQTCQKGKWGECIGAINPTTEICDQKDNDCDGEIDENYVCGMPESAIIDSCANINCPSCQHCSDGNCVAKPNGYNDCGLGCQRCIEGSCQDYNAACPSCQYCSSDACVNYCAGTDIDCGCTNCVDCNNLDDWVNTGSSYPCCDGNKSCTCQQQEYRDYRCLSGSCSYSVTETRISKSGCVECGSSKSCLNGICQSNCAGTDISCGSTTCINCNASDGCSGNSYLDYYCSGTSCVFNSDDCSDCSCTCGGYNIIESIANGNCNDGKDNDCDGAADLEDFECLPSGTKVGGIIPSDTTWAKENSPYVITSTIQIPSGATLAIEPGVTVISPTSGDMFLLNGTIYAHGTIDNKIIFDGENNSNFFNTEEGDSDTFLDLDFCVVKNVVKLIDYPLLHGGVNLTHSELINFSLPSHIGDPEQDVYIEYNKFINACGFESHLVGKGKLYIRYNLFHSKNQSCENYWVRSRRNLELPGVIVKYNSFIDTKGISLRLGEGYDTAAILAVENYWGTSDTNIIDTMIYDKNDDIRIKNYIDYLPILTEPHLDVLKP